MRILLIDDDEPLMEVLANNLIEQHYAVDIATTGEMGWEFILLFNYDLVVLDWMLPDIDGISLCQRIRAEGYEMPIMLLTARDRHGDKVKGLDAGADDYVVKPFNFEELTARIRALLRRDIQVSSPVLQWDKMTLDPRTHEVKHLEQLLPLTPKEYGLLELFLRHPQQVFSPGAIIDSLWAGEDPPGEEAVRTHIKGLRQKLKASGMAKDTIQTVYGVGYRLKATAEEQPQLVNNKTESNKEKIKRAWSVFKDVTQERLNILEQLKAALISDRLSDELYHEAKSAAHKLAGSLGGFGFPEGSNVAKQIETLLNTNATDLARETNILLLGQLLDNLCANIQHQPWSEKVKSTLDRNISLLIIDSGRTSSLSSPSFFAQQLAEEAIKQGIATQVTSHLDLAQELINSNPPTAVLLKIVFPDGEELNFLEQLHQQLPMLPIIVMIEDAQFSDRLEVVRRGSSLVLQYPASLQETIAAIIELLQGLSSSAKIMIVDDDPQVLMSLEISLQPWGFQVTTLDDPLQFWQVLERVNPDLLVLDVEMPEINGIELCQVLRTDRRWQQLPVLFLTVHQDEKTQHQAFAIGADDYLCKPIVGSELANRILNRLERSRLK